MIECDVKVFFSLSFYIFFPAVNKLVELVLLAIKPWNDRNDKIIAILFIFHLTITLTFILLSYQVRCFFLFCFILLFDSNDAQSWIRWLLSSPLLLLCWWIFFVAHSVWRWCCVCTTVNVYCLHFITYFCVSFILFGVGYCQCGDETTNRFTDKDNGMKFNLSSGMNNNNNKITHTPCSGAISFHI